MIVFAEFVLQTEACNDGVVGILSQEKTRLRHSPVKSCCPIAKLFDHQEGVFVGIYNCTVVAILDIFS